MACGSSLLLQRFSPCCISQPGMLPSLGSSSDFSPLICEGAPVTGCAIVRVSASLPRETHVAVDVSHTHISGNGAHLLHNQTSSPSPSSSTRTLQSPCHGEPASPLTDEKLLASSLRAGRLDASMHSYRGNFVIRCYEVGMNRTASIETIANLLQEVGCDHAQSVGFSTDGFATTPLMRKQRLIWVTTRMHIEVDEYPVWGDVVQIETWIQSEGKVGTRRDWLMTNVATGRLIGRATSTWVMMNQDTRRLSRITEDVRNEYTRYCPKTPRFAFPEENACSLKKIPKLEGLAEHIRSGLMPRRGDLDMNQHVNNVTYIGWTLESMPHHLVDTHQLHTITLDYRRECKYDDVVESLASLEYCASAESKDPRIMPSLCATISNGAAINGTVSESPEIGTSSGGFEFLHLLRLAGTDIEINRGRTVWQKKLERM